MAHKSPLSLALACLFAPAAAFAQAWSYPAMQPPRIAHREFNFAVADAGGGGTSLLFQWRESAARRSQLSFDLGVNAPDSRGGDNALFAYGQYAYQIRSADPEVPLDFLFTVGLGAAFGSLGVVRVPVGVSLGRRFELEQNLALTPWVHPRVSFDTCDCRGRDTSLGVAFDLGANLDLSRRLAVRAALLFAGNELFNNDGFAVSLAWTPPGLVRPR